MAGTGLIRVTVATKSKVEPHRRITSEPSHAIILDGELWLELDDRETVHLEAGDIRRSAGDTSCLAQQRQTPGDNRLRDARRLTTANNSATRRRLS
jgi:hypothetical protein